MYTAQKSSPAALLPGRGLLHRLDTVSLRAASAPIAGAVGVPKHILRALGGKITHMPALLGPVLHTVFDSLPAVQAPQVSLHLCGKKRKMLLQRRQNLLCPVYSIGRIGLHGILLKAQPEFLRLPQLAHQKRKEILFVLRVPGNFLFQQGVPFLRCALEKSISKNLPMVSMVTNDVVISRSYKTCRHRPSPIEVPLFCFVFQNETLLLSQSEFCR